MQLIDTSIWLDFINKRGSPKRRVRIQTLIESRKAVWCPMVLLELQRSTKERESALSLLGEVLITYEINQSVWRSSFEIARSAYRRGKTIPNSDILIYATACHYEAKILHNDKHFDWLDGITGQNIAERLAS